MVVVLASEEVEDEPVVGIIVGEKLFCLTFFTFFICPGNGIPNRVGDFGDFGDFVFLVGDVFLKRFKKLDMIEEGSWQKWRNTRDQWLVQRMISTIISIVWFRLPNDGMN